MLYAERACAWFHCRPVVRRQAQSKLQSVFQDVFEILPPCCSCQSTSHPKTWQSTLVGCVVLSVSTDKKGQHALTRDSRTGTLAFCALMGYGFAGFEWMEHTHQAPRNQGTRGLAWPVEWAQHHLLPGLHRGQRSVLRTCHASFSRASSADNGSIPRALLPTPKPLATSDGTMRLFIHAQLRPYLSSVARIHRASGTWSLS